MGKAVATVDQVEFRQLHTVYTTGERLPATRTDLQGWIANIWFRSQKVLITGFPWQSKISQERMMMPPGDGVSNFLDKLGIAGWTVDLEE